MYHITPSSFNDILLDNNDFTYLSSDIVCNFFCRPNFEKYSQYRYYRLNNHYCCYEFQFKKYDDTLFIFFPGSEINTSCLHNPDDLLWRNADHYLDSTLFILCGLNNYLLNFLNSSQSICKVRNIVICCISLGSIPGYFYLFNLVNNLSKYTNIRNIYLELYSTINLPEQYRKTISNSILENINKDVQIYLRYHIVEYDIVSFIRYPFLFDVNIDKDVNIHNIIYYYHLNDNNNNHRPFFQKNHLLQQHCYNAHSSSHINNINFGFFSKITVLTSIQEANHYFSKCYSHSYKDSLSFLNFIRFLYTQYGCFLGLNYYREFSYLVSMYANMLYTINSIFL